MNDRPSVLTDRVPGPYPTLGIGRSKLDALIGKGRPEAIALDQIDQRRFAASLNAQARNERCTRNRPGGRDRGQHDWVEADPGRRSAGCPESDASASRHGAGCTSPAWAALDRSSAHRAGDRRPPETCCRTERLAVPAACGPGRVGVRVQRVTCSGAARHRLSNARQFRHTFRSAIELSSGKEKSGSSISSDGSSI
jgi:hypothetical protein